MLPSWLASGGATIAAAILTILAGMWRDMRKQHAETREMLIEETVKTDERLSGHEKRLDNHDKALEEHGKSIAELKVKVGR